MNAILYPGDVVVTPFIEELGLSHYSLVEGTCNNGITWAIHNMPERGVDRIQLNALISNGLERVDQFKGTAEDRNKVLQRAKGLIGTQYDLLKFNCEHFARYCQSGVVRSCQIDSVKILLRITCFFIALWIVNKILINLNIK